MWRIFYKILSVPHNIFMALNNVMPINIHPKIMIVTIDGNQWWLMTMEKISKDNTISLYSL